MFCFIAVFLLAIIPSTLGLTAPLELTKRDSTPSVFNIQNSLGPKLCTGGSIYFPSSPEFADLTERWSTATEGDILVVVVAVCEKDVATAVKFANLANLPFLATNRGHGTTLTLKKIKHGVLIKLSNFNTIDIAEDGNSAFLGGGVYADQVLEKLAEKNKVASLIADNILELDVITADGSKIKVSKYSHPNLYWGMRGAGQNFGIVTKFRHKIFDYPRGQDTYYVTYIFSEDKLETLFTRLNKLLNNGQLPRDANTYILYTFNPDANPKFTYFGTIDEAQPYLKPFIELGPLSTFNGTTPFPKLRHALGQGVTDPLCAAGKTTVTFPVGLETYNVETNRKVYELFTEMVTQAPDLKGSFIQFEGYSLQGMKAVDPISTAYGHRDDNILVSYTMAYPPSAANDAVAAKYGRQGRQLFIDGEAPRPHNAYPNYAYGDETVQQLYGYEPWRLQKLRKLKKKWDPNGRACGSPYKSEIPSLPPISLTPDPPSPRPSVTSRARPTKTIHLSPTIATTSDNGLQQHPQVAPLSAVTGTSPVGDGSSPGDINDENNGTKLPAIVTPVPSSPVTAAPLSGSNPKAAAPPIQTSVNLGNKINTSSEGAYVIDSQTLVPSSAIQYYGIPVSLVPGGSALVVGGSTIPLGLPARPLPLTKSPSASLVGGAVAGDPHSGIVIGTQTAYPAGPTITVSGTRYSLKPSALVVGVSTYSHPPENPSALFTAGGLAATRNCMSEVVIGGQTLVPGAGGINFGGTKISFASSGTAVVIGISTIPLG
ncbi:MAG: hypothetical protein Q9167_000797 [Letrouitia subvulpina]